MKKIFRFTRKHISRGVRHIVFSRGFWIFAVIALLLFLAIIFMRGIFHDVFQNALKERQFENVERIAPTVAVRVENENLLASSFTDIFSGTGWINEGETTLYRDNVTQAFSWKPVVFWARGSGVLPIRTSSELCVKSRCGRIQGENFVFDGTSLALPKELEHDNRQLALVSLGEGLVLTGAIPEGGNTAVFAFTFDGNTFSPLCSVSKIFTSPYKGTLAVGGGDGRALILFGAYEGKAVETHGDSCTDVSRFFGIRAMEGGFHPEIIRTEGNWFIFSADDAPVLLKGIGDIKTGGLVGTLDIGTFLKRDGISGFRFGTPLKKDAPLQGTLLFTGGILEAGTVRDLGFEPQAEARVTSKNLNTYPNSLTRRASIVSAEIFSGSTAPEFFLSNNGKDWLPVRVGEEIAFPDKNGRGLYWKVLFPKTSEGGSPYFKRIRVDFKVKI